MTQEQNRLPENQVSQKGYRSYLGVILQKRVETSREAEETPF